MLKKKQALGLLITDNSLLSQAGRAQVTKNDLPKEKQTALELYITAKEAYEMWKADSGKIKVLDVRTPEEYIFIGHPAMAWNIPIFFQTYEWDSVKQQFPMKPNPGFMKQIGQLFNQSDTILVTCRSGGRSAMAVNQLAQAGYKYAFNIIDGFEGDMVNDPESVYKGQRLKNGWKNAGLPWTYDIDPSLIKIQSNQ